MCGKLTKGGASDENNTYSGKTNTSNNFQPDGSNLYDGDTQDKWNLEEIVVDNQSNSFLIGASTVYLRFIFETDGTNSQDAYYNADFEGFTFDDFTCIQIAGNSIGVDEIDASDFTIYPNPASGSFSVEGIEGSFGISMYNSLGQLLYEEQDLYSSEQIEIGTFASGILLVKVEINGAVYFKKILKD